MATDCISREAANDLLAMALIDDWEPEYAQDRLSEIPAADVVEVVRCKDCMHWEDNFGYCDVWEYYVSNQDFFCGCGKRRTDDG